MIHGDGLSAKVNLDPKGVVHPAPRLFPWPAVDDLGKPSTAFNRVGRHWFRPLGPDEKQSLENLVTHVLSRQKWVPDDIVFRLWHEHVRQVEVERAEALAHREGGYCVVTVDEWRQRHEAILPPEEGNLFRQGLQ